MLLPPRFHDFVTFRYAMPLMRYFARAYALCVIE